MDSVEMKITLCLIAILVFAKSNSATPVTPSNRQMEKWWDDLQNPEPDASNAILNFADNPIEAVAFLKARLKPLTLSKQQLEKLLVQLASDDNRIWEAAFEDLDYLDPRLVIELEQLMNNVTDTPARQRLVELMSGQPRGSLSGQDITLRRTKNGYNFFSVRGSWWAEHRISRLNIEYSNPKKKWTRAIRAIVLLKHIGTTDAITVLKQMALHGHPEAHPTKVARELALRITKETR